MDKYRKLINIITLQIILVIFNVYSEFRILHIAILGYTDLALENLDKDHKVAPYLVNVLNASEHATALVQQILTYARKSEKEKKTVELAQVIKEALKLLRASLPALIEIIESINSNKKNKWRSKPDSSHYYKSMYQRKICNA